MTFSLWCLEGAECFLRRRLDDVPPMAEEEDSSSPVVCDSAPLWLGAEEVYARERRCDLSGSAD